MSKHKKKAGRPPGVKNGNLPTATIHTSRCPKCDSHAREEYFAVTRRIYGSTEVIRRRTRCTNCGQARIDREERPATMLAMPTIAGVS